ncbi:hypothetical protein QYF36_005441 [Acer negundo]|nr:hypothetical protein QYF36_005441 [Acer negundo]
MSLQVSDIASASTQSVKRHTTTYHPSIWGDHFLKYASHSLPIDATTQEEYKELKHEVRRMLISTTSDEISEKLRLIDAVQRLVLLPWWLASFQLCLVLCFSVFWLGLCLQLLPEFVVLVRSVGRLLFWVLFWAVSALGLPCWGYPLLVFVVPFFD